LTGQVPDITELTSLSQLNLQSNSFTGVIPTLNMCLLLTNLDLSNNLFTSQIPNWIGSCTYLTYLDLSFNLLVGTVPSSFGNLKFQLLNLQNNQLASAYPSFLQGHRLNLANNAFYGQITEVPRGVNALVLDGNQFTGSLPDIPPSLSDSFQELWIRGNLMQGNIPDSYVYAVRLQQLHVDNNLQLAGQMPSLLMTYNGGLALTFANTSLTCPDISSWRIWAFSASCNFSSAQGGNDNTIVAIWASVVAAIVVLTLVISLFFLRHRIRGYFILRESSGRETPSGHETISDRE